ncbi:hypothetical protein [Nannocystis sp. SCPEA4]|uniref:hypothetical protein n=1 Tax=Nannocystis sp. SCPEA4 TaxID=2996787 RepID=UPI00226EF42D|nr:hypothetical protein [Nannocystis sp. SCPEA4]MCY1062123.1 hypothetical protein [Nannocystis sp. SCPEA4]
MIDVKEVVKYVEGLLSGLGLQTRSRVMRDENSNFDRIIFDAHYTGVEKEPERRAAAADAALGSLEDRLDELDDCLAMQRVDDPVHYEGEVPRPDVRQSFAVQVYVRGAQEEKADAAWRARKPLPPPGARQA